MNTTASITSPTGALGRDRPPALKRLSRVELRKMTDTRSGFWLLLATLALAVTVAIVSAVTGHQRDHTLHDVLNSTLQALNVLLPIVGVLLVTSEYSQRTTLITFVLVPQRLRVLAAKLLAGVVLALVAWVAALALSALGTLVDPASSGAWTLRVGLLAQTILFAVLSMLLRMALGVALLIPAAAIVASFVLPIGFAALTSIHGLDPVSRWLSQSDNLNHLTDHVLDGSEWAHLATTTLLWLALPLSIGVYRLTRNDVR
jgi:ABC-type transport system involved in multi-copper enzyme maturation permease subunit